MDRYAPIEKADPIVKPMNSDNIETSSFDNVASMFEEEKSSPTIEREINDFQESGNDKGFSIEDLETNNSKIEENVQSEQPQDEQPQEDIEDYFDSAEFVIFIIELVIVWGTNLYLKREELDKISIEEFEKTAREQKMLVRSWSKILMKHSLKVGAELELLMAMGSAYGMKIKGIVKTQELKKELEIKEANKRKNKVKKESKNINEVDSEETLNNNRKNENKPKERKRKHKKNKSGENDFILDSKVIDEIKEEEKKQGVADLI